VDITSLIELILFILLMGLSGFFSSSETAMFSLKRMELEQMRRDGHPRIDLIEHMLSQPRRLIMTILIGNELVNVSASAISAAVVIQLLGAESMWINLAIMVPILLLVGEIVPKTLAVRNNIAFAGFESRPIEFFAALVKPVRWLIRKVADRFITLIVGAERSRGNIITEDMVRTLAYDGVDEGALESQEAQFIDHILAFNDKKLGDLKTPRSHIFCLPVEMPPTAMMVEMRQARHTKAPVYHKQGYHCRCSEHKRLARGRYQSAVAGRGRLGKAFAGTLLRTGNQARLGIVSHLSRAEAFPGPYCR